ERLLGVIRDEVGAMGQHVRAVGAATAEGLVTRWPLEDMLGADVVQAALRHIELAGGLRAAAADVDASVWRRPGGGAGGPRPPPADVDASLWLKVDSFSLLQALTSLACRLHEELGVD